MKNRLFLKITAATLVFTFSYSQLVYADARQMLVDAKRLFDEEDALRPRGMTSEQLAANEQQQQAAVEQQQALEDFQNPSFSLTTQNGDILSYVGNKLKRVKRADGSTLNNIVTDASGNIRDANLRLSDGGIQIYRDGAVIGYTTPDGSQVIYENGVIQKVIAKSGIETVYTYTKDAEGNILGTVLDNPSFRSEYDADGTLKKTLKKEDGTITEYLDSRIDRIQKQDGTLFIFKQLDIAAGVRVELDRQVDVNGIETLFEGNWAVVDDVVAFKHVIYDGLGSPTEILGRDGSRMTFDAGILKKVWDADGNETQFDFTQSVYSNLVGTRIVQQGVSSRYDAEGALAELDLGSAKIFYKPGSTEIDRIETADGAAIRSPRFNASNDLMDAEITTPDGDLRVYEDGKLVEIIKADTMKLFYLDEKLTKVITPEKLTYHFDYTAPEFVVATLDSSVTVSDALTAIQMQYSPDFSLKKAVRQNQEILNYLNDDLISIQRPGAATQEFQYVKDVNGKVLSYTVTEENVETFYDANDQVLRSVIHPTADNAHTLDIAYQYGKIREIKKDGVLTFKYSYSFDSAGVETTQIEDIQEQTLKNYRDNKMLTSLNKDTSVLSSYSYTDEKVSNVSVTRFGRMLHSYAYTYQGTDTIVSDEEGVKRTYSQDKKLTALEKQGEKFVYSYAPGADGNEVATEQLAQKTLSDGSIARYASHKIVSIERPDGTMLSDIQVNPDRSLKQATVALADGTKRVFDASKILEEIAVDGTRFHFTDGKVSKVTKTNGTELVYSYEKDQAGVVTAIWVKSGEANLKYEVNGALTSLKLDGVTVAIDGARQFYDGSAAKYAVTAAGDVKLSTSSFKSGRASATFDGNGDYLSLPPSQDWALGAGDWTVDFWVKPESTNQTQYLAFSGVVGASYGWSLNLNTSNQLQFSAGTGGWACTTYTASSSPLTANNWHHVAVERSGNTVLIYVNGTLATGYSTTISNFSATSNPLNLVGYNNSYWFKGNLDEFRVSKGVARWTSNFAPPAERPIDTYTKLSLGFDGIDNSQFKFEKEFGANGQLAGYAFSGDAGKLRFDANGSFLSLTGLDDPKVKTGVKTFVDSGVSNYVVQSFGDAGLSTNAMKAGDMGASFDGSGDYLAINDSDDFNFGAGDFTIDGWVKFNSLSNSYFYSQWGDSQAGNTIGLSYYNNSLQFCAINSGSYLSYFYGNWTPAVGAWYHLAVVRSGSTWKLYVNGQVIATKTAPGAVGDYNGKILIGAVGYNTPYAAPYYFNGSMDEWRVSKGIARWVGDFAPQAINYAADAYTKALLHFDAPRTSPDPVVSAKLSNLSQPLAAFLPAGALLPYAERINSSGARPLPADFGTWVATANGSILPGDTIMAQEYTSSTGVLETQTKADGTTILFDDDNRPSQVMDDAGNSLIQYFYDADGHPSRIYLKNARDKLPDEVRAAKQSVEEQRAQSLRSLSQQMNLAYQSIQSQADAQREPLLQQLGTLNGQYGSVAGTSASGKKAKSQRGDALNQIDDVRGQVSSALSQIAAQEADAYARLDGSVKAVSDQVEADARTAYTQLAAQEENLKKEIIRQEISPIVYDYYRRILGRDPSTAEYNEWISKIDYTSGEEIIGWNEEESMKPGSSVYFDGVGDWVETPYSADWNMGAGDWTVDGWIKLNAVNVEQTIAAYTPTNNSHAHLMYINPSNRFTLYLSQDGATTVNITANTAFQKGIWYHWAAVKQGSTYSVYVNGQKEVSTSSSANLFAYNNSWRIGNTQTGNSSLNGWLEEFRISKGIARYSQNFTPGDLRQAPDPYTKLLLRTEGNALKDAASTPHSLSLGGNAKADGAQSKTQEKTIVRTPITRPITQQLVVGDSVQESWGPGASLALDGSGDYLSVADSDDFNFGSGNFTIDGWVKFNSVSNCMFYSQWGDSVNGNSIGLGYYNGVLQFYVINSASYFSYFYGNWTPVVGTWYHLAVVRNGNDLRTYINGQTLASQTVSGAINDFNGKVLLGALGYNTPYASPYYFNGAMDEWRVSKGIARWSGNFAPQTVNYENDTYTKLLLRSSSNGQAMVDVSPSARAISSFGDARPGVQYKVQKKTIIHTPIKKDLTLALKETLEASPELVERTAYVYAVKQSVTSAVNSYLAMTQAQKEAYAVSLGLTVQDLIPLSSSDAGKILSWLSTRSNHFGQSAFLSLESLLDKNGISYAREDIAKKCILVDILTGVINPLDDGDLVISVFALNKVAERYGLSLSGARLSWEELRSIYAANEAVIGEEQYTVLDAQSSVRFDGSGDELRFANSADWALGNGEWTIDGWVKLDPQFSTEAHLISNWNGATGSEWMVGITPDRKVFIYNGSFTYSGTTLSLNTWQHIAVVRSGTQLAMYVNGQKVTSVNYSANFNSTVGVVVGNEYYYGKRLPFKGWMDGLRLSKGIARYSDNFAPSTLRLVADEYTKLLLYSDATGIKDKSAFARTMTVVGDTKVDSATYAQSTQRTLTRKVILRYPTSVNPATLTEAQKQDIIANPEKYNPQVIAHINGNHYVVIMGMTDTSVTYMDPGKGKDKQNEVITLSKADFLKGWKGNVTLQQSVIASLPQAGAAISAKVLSNEETKKIRGAFFFFFIPALAGALSSIGAAVASVVTGIAAMIGNVGVIVGQALANIGQLFSGVGGVLHGIGTSIFQGISFAASSLFGAIGNPGTVMSQSVFGSAAKASFGNALFQSAVKVGLNLAITKGLDTLGVNPIISGLTSSFMTGGLMGGFDAKGIFQTSNFAREGFKSFAFSGAQTIFDGIGFDSGLSNALALAGGQFVGGLMEGELGGQLVKIGQTLSTNLSLYGLEKMGASLGLSPTVATAIAAPISLTFGQGLARGNIDGQQIVRSVQDGLYNGAVRYGLDFAVDQMGVNNPLLQGLAANAITASVSSLLDPNGNLLRDVLTRASSEAIGTLELISTPDFNRLAQQKGISKALEMSAASVFTRSSQEDIIKAGGIAQLISGRAQLVDIDGTTLRKININSNESFYLDSHGNLVALQRSIGNGSEIYSGNFSITDKGAKLMSGVIGTIYSDGSVSTIQVREGKTYQISISKTPGRSNISTIEGPEGQSWVSFDVQPEQTDILIKANDTGSLNIDGAMLLDGALIYKGFNAQIDIAHGYGRSISVDSGQDEGDGTAAIDAHSLTYFSEVDYLLLNGIRGETASEGIPPAYFDPTNQYSFVGTLGAEPEVVQSKIDYVALFEDQKVKWLDNSATNTIDIIVDAVWDVARSRFAEQKEVRDVVNKLNVIHANQATNFVPLAYSGGGMTLLKALNGGGDTYDLIKTVIFVGAPMNLPSSVYPPVYFAPGKIINPNVNKVINIYGDRDPLQFMFSNDLGVPSTINIVLEGISHDEYFYSPELYNELVNEESRYAFLSEFNQILGRETHNKKVADLKAKIERTLYADAFIGRLAANSDDETLLNAFLNDFPRENGKIIVDPASIFRTRLAELKQKKGIV